VAGSIHIALQQLQERRAKLNRRQSVTAPVDDIDALDRAIARVSEARASMEAKSLEGCVNALVALLRAKRELFPPDTEELAAIAFRHGITPEDFVQALNARILRS
jgi:hypothetical protein